MANETISRPSDTICGACANIDFGSIFKATKSYQNTLDLDSFSEVPTRGHHVASLGTRLSPSSPCKVCRFLWELRIPSETRSEPEYDLCAFSQFMPLSGRESSHFVFLAVLPQDEVGFPAGNWASLSSHRLITLAQPDEGNAGTGKSEYTWLREIGPLADLRAARQWLDECTGSHQQCRIPEELSFHLGHTDSIVDDGLCLIDCREVSREVKRRPFTERYVALSYARDARDDASPTASPEWLSNIAPEIAAGLGFEYLWVDDICNKHPDGNAKEPQTGFIQQVFQNAELTIIVASGNPANCIPGVSNRPRKSRSQVKVGDLLLSATLQDPKQTLSKSAWASQTLTYQEAAFSRRWLVFNDEQLHWICASSEVEESSLHRHNILRDTIISRSSRIFQPVISNSTRSSAATDWNIIDRLSKHIEEYSKRTSFEESETLTGISDIVSHYSRLSSGSLRTILGTPMWTGVAMEEHRVVKESFILNLLWDNFFPAVPLGTVGIGSRRCSFPSWSWAGWDCAVAFRNPSRYLSSFFEPPKSQSKFNWKQSVESVLDSKDVPNTGASEEVAPHGKKDGPEQSSKDDKGGGLRGITITPKMMEEHDARLSVSPKRPWFADVSLTIPGTDEIVDPLLRTEATEPPEIANCYLNLCIKKPYILGGKDLENWGDVTGFKNLGKNGRGGMLVTLYSMDLYLQTAHQNEAEQPDFWEGVNKGNLLCVLLNLVPNDTMFPVVPTVKGRFLVLTKIEKDNKTIVWERIGLLSIEAKADSYEEWHQEIGTMRAENDVIVQ